MAYASKYYDPVKAHEYYEKYRKKGLSKKRTSTAGLSEEGKAAAAEVKDRLTEELNAALKGLPRKSPKRQALRDAMNEKYAQELEKIRQDQSMVKQKEAKASKGKAKSSKAKQTGSKTKQTQANVSKKKIDQKAVKQAVARMQEQIDKLRDKIANLSPEQKALVKESLLAIIDQLKAQQKKTKKSGLSSEGKKLLKSAEKINATAD